MKNFSEKRKADPSVECLTKLFPEDFIRNTASETGFIQRERKIDPVIRVPPRFLRTRTLSDLASLFVNISGINSLFPVKRREIFINKICTSLRNN